MKTAIYIENGREQVVLTPENDLEKSVLHNIEKAQRQLAIYRGEFYACRGGWTRHRDTSEPQSLIIVLDAPPPQMVGGSMSE